MKTEIFKNYLSFLEREDKDVNGVDEDFAKENPNYFEEKNNKGCWSCSGCSDCSDCSDCSGCYDCYRCSGCSDCSGCYRCSGCSGCYRCYSCSDCSDCSDCSGCYDCYRCSGCSGLKNVNREDKNNFVVPKIVNIHNKILEVVSQPNSLEMGSWHTCDTTHCRGGWVVHLAGEPGRILEKETFTLFAAMQIYKKSSKIKVSPPRFFDTNEEAMKDIIRCAEMES